jgi:hypothetical protein
MKFAVSTVKDTPANVEKFVSRNLAGGIDHLVVFLDDPADPETPGIRAALDADEHVTCVVADEAWWGAKRPERLNVRQRIHANLVKALLTTVDSAEWVFHIDADEVVRLDPQALAQVPANCPAVQLATLEAVSQESWPEDPQMFKRLLDAPDLTLLHVLGVIDRPHNGAYFHGHVDGKSGVRPATDVWLTLHRAIDDSGTEVQVHRDDRLRVLHYESYSGEDFIRKWTALLGAGPLASFRAGREPTAVALQALVSRGLTPEQARPLLMRIYRATTEDDLETLQTLGLLEHVDPASALTTPASMTDAERAWLRTLLDRAAGRPKKAFHPGEPSGRVRKLVAELSDDRPRRTLRR